MPSLKCHQCGKVKLCRLHRDEHTKAIIYLCPACERELGYATPAQGAAS
jgi:hypothetical protein